MAQPPAYQWYPGDALSSSKIQRMTLEEEGAYRRLLDFQWMDGFIPADIGELSRMCKSTPRKMALIWDKLRTLGCFQPTTEDPDKLVNLRLERVRAERKEYSQEQAERARIRWEKQRNAEAMHSHMQAHSDGSTDSMPRAGNALQSSVSNLQTSKKEKPSLRSGKTKCPDLFPVTDQDREWALVNHITIDLEAESEAMLDWARGKGELKADWQATRRNWWREAQRRSGRNHGKFAKAAAATENPNTGAAQDFARRRMAETLLPDVSDVREDSQGLS